jgi:DNA-binding LacI/PurR family transcriptional regulator
VEYRRPTLLDVARTAGVSRSTASRAINNQAGVAVGVRQRVLRAADLLGFHPDSSARALASGHADVFDLVVIDEDPYAFAMNPFYGRVAAGIMVATADTDVRLRIHLTARRTAVRVLDEVAGSGGLGTLLVNVPSELAQPFHDRCRRMVSFGRFDGGVPFTEADTTYGASLGVGHLISAGRRVIAAIDGPPGNPCAAHRHAGYVATMDAAGLSPLWMDGDFTRRGGYEAMLRLLDARPDIDAVFAACDATATGALQALAEAGRRVPDDVAVVGFDDSVLAASTNPPMTSVRQPVEEMATRATRDLLHGQVSADWQAYFPVTLSVRASSV